MPLSLEQPSPSIKILVVEDNLINQKVILHQLQSLGYATDLAINGQAAIQCTMETNYPIILMDCRLPQMDGYTATRHIRAQIATQGKPQPIIIALTASDDPEAEAEAKAAGMNDFLTKPLRRETLAAVIERWQRVMRANQPDGIASKPAASPNSVATEALTSKRFDFNQLHQLSDHNPEFEQELLLLYFEDTQIHLQQLQQAWNEQNRQQLEHLAHHIKGASANIGARQLAQIAAEIEQQTAQQIMPSLHDLLLRLGQIFQETQQFFAALRQIPAPEAEQPESKGSQIQ